MAISVTIHPSDTAIGGYTQQKLDLGPLNFGTDFKQLTSKNPNELTYVNINSTFECPEKIRITWNEIPDVYKGSQISEAVKAPVTRGVKLYIQLRDTVSVTDAAVPDFQVLLPIESHFVTTVPSAGYITEANILEIVGRMLAVLFPTGSTASTWLAGALRGSIQKG